MVSHNDRFAHLEDAMNARFDDLTATASSMNNDILQIRRILIDNLIQENKHLHKRVRSIEDRMIKMERQINCTEQNNRKSNVEIEGIPSKIGHNDLKSIVARLLNHLSNSNITEGDIEAVHRINVKKQPQPTIVRMKRNLLDEIKSKEGRSKLKGIAEKMGFDRGTKIYVNDNLSPNMRNLAYNARILKRSKLIEDTWFANAAVRIRLTPGASPVKVTHEEDLFKLFPNFQGFSFDCDFFSRIREDNEIDDYDHLDGYSLHTPSDGDVEDNDEVEKSEDENVEEEADKEKSEQVHKEWSVSSLHSTEMEQDDLTGDDRHPMEPTGEQPTAPADPSVANQPSKEEVQQHSSTTEVKGSHVNAISSVPPPLEEIPPSLVAEGNADLSSSKKKKKKKSTKDKDVAPPNITRSIAKSLTL